MRCFKILKLDSFKYHSLLIVPSNDQCREVYGGKTNFLKFLPCCCRSNMQRNVGPFSLHFDAHNVTKLKMPSSANSNITCKVCSCLSANMTEVIAEYYIGSTVEAPCVTTSRTGTVIGYNHFSSLNCFHHLVQLERIWLKLNKWYSLSPN